MPSTLAVAIGVGAYIGAKKYFSGGKTEKWVDNKVSTGVKKVTAVVKKKPASDK